MSKKPKSTEEKTNVIPDDEHVVRFCKNRLLIRENGEVIAVHPELFALRGPTQDKPQEKYLSAVHYEHATDAANRMKACVGCLRITPKPKDGLARINIGLMKQQGEKRKRKLRAEKGYDGRPISYAAILGLPTDADYELNGLLALMAVVETIEIRHV